MCAGVITDTPNENIKVKVFVTKGNNTVILFKFRKFSTK